MSSNSLWIQDIDIKTGALRSYVYHTYGKGGFDDKGRIKQSILRELAHNGKSQLIRKRANLALTFKHIRTGNKEFRL